MKSKIFMFFLLLSIIASFALAETQFGDTSCVYEVESGRSLEDTYTKAWYRDNDNVDGHWEHCWGKAFLQECWCESCDSGGFSCVYDTSPIVCEWSCEDGRCLRDRQEANLPPLGNLECFDMDDEGYETGNCNDGGRDWDEQTVAMSKQFGNKWDHCKGNYEYEAYCNGNQALLKKSFCGDCGCDEDMIGCLDCDTTVSGCCLNPNTVGCRRVETVDQCCPPGKEYYGGNGPSTIGDCFTGGWFFEFEGNSEFSAGQACQAMAAYRDPMGNPWPHSELCNDGLCCHGNADGSIDADQTSSSECTSSFDWYIPLEQITQECNGNPESVREMESCCAEYLKNVPVELRTGNPDSKLDTIDKDGVMPDVDNCPNDYNPNQDNDDSDTYGNVCDNCPFETNEDQDPAACTDGGSNTDSTSSGSTVNLKGGIIGAVFGAIIVMFLVAALAPLIPIGGWLLALVIAAGVIIGGLIGL